MLTAFLMPHFMDHLSFVFEFVYIVFMLPCAEFETRSYVPWSWSVCNKGTSLDTASCEGTVVCMCRPILYMVPTMQSECTYTYSGKGKWRCSTLWDWITQYVLKINSACEHTVLKVVVVSVVVN